MASTSSKGYFARRSHLFLPVSKDDRDSLTVDSDSGFDFDESDIYNSGRANSLEFRRSLKKPSTTTSSCSKVGDAGAPASVPVNVPDWSKILGDEYMRSNNNHMRRKSSVEEDEEEEDGGGGWLPPHEYLARTRVASFSVQEGMGRTLKGRDLSRVRNAIWAKTGFQD